MSYLARLKARISEKDAGGEGTKGTKGAFVPFVAPGGTPSRQISERIAFDDNDPLTDTAAEPSLRHASPMLAGGPDRERGEQIAELRRLVEAIVRMAPAYWTRADIEEAVAIGATDLDNALMTFRALAQDYGIETRLIGKH